MSEKDWKWFGSPGHFICGEDCRFHLCTQVGKFLVSTVGEYFPDAPVREILAKSRGKQLEGMGDARRADYMNKVGYEEIGCGRKFETMVFRVTKGLCKCGCGAPNIDWSDIDCAPYNDRKSANAGHAAMCRKWAKKRTERQKKGA